MAGVRFTELQSRPMEFLDFTSLTLDEFQQLSTWTEIFPQNSSHFHYPNSDDMRASSNPWKAT
jgi:hypothetical protein